MNINSKFFVGTLCLLLNLSYSASFSQEVNPLEGRWNLTISQEGKELPSWLEIRHSGYHTYVGRFVYAFGSARPVSEIKITDSEKFSFEIPVQWEPGDSNMVISGQLIDDKIKGTLLYTDGETYQWTGAHAPNLPYVKDAVWGKPKALFNGKNLKGWSAMGENQWIVESGILKSPESGANLVSDEKFMDFKLHIEFRYPEGSNSGVYLRGRYEVQVTDSKGKEPSDIEFSGVYGFLTPNEMAAKSAGEWQSYDITLIGRRVTVIANGVTVINDQNIPGITGGALDSKEGEPGPFMIQGDHGPIEYRNIVVTPRVDSK